MTDIAMENHRARMKLVYRLKSRREFVQKYWPSIVGVVLSIAAIAASAKHLINVFN